MKFTLHLVHRHYFLHKGHRKWMIFPDHFLQKTCGLISLSSPGVKLGSSKYCHFWNVIIHSKASWQKGQSAFSSERAYIWFMKKQQNTKGTNCKNFGAKLFLWLEKKAKLTSVMRFLTQYWRMLCRISYYLAVKMMGA